MSAGSLMADDRVYAGIDIGGTNIKFGLFDSSGKILFRDQKPTQADKGPTPLMHLLSNIAERLLYLAADDELPVKYLGVGSPGAVDFRSGKVIGTCPNIPGWQGAEIGAALRERLNLPVFVDNDANAVALAETRFGAAAGSKSVVCVTVGTGIGGGLVIDGKLWRGAFNAGAELGHMPINFDGPECGCGRRGCIEAYCSSRAMIERVKTRTKSGLTPILKEILNGDPESLTVKKVFQASQRGDEAAMAAISETARFLGIGLSGIVNLLNPETIVIGGGVTDGGGGFVEAVAAEIRQRAFDSAVEGLRIVKAALGNNAGFIGAGLLGEEAI